MSGMTETRRIRIYFDTNIFIALLGASVDVRAALLRLYHYGAGAPHQIITSELTIAEALVVPITRAIERNDYAERDRFNTMLTSKGDFQVMVPASADILEYAALLRANAKLGKLPSLKLPDAIHLATILRTGCDVLVSNDGGLRKAAEAIASSKGGQLGEAKISGLSPTISLDVSELQALDEILRSI